MPQNFSNHIRYYAPHHYIFLPLMFLLMILGIWKGFSAEQNNLVWWLFAVTSFCILYLAIMLRQHYALGNQDRIVRLEFRLRYFELYGKDSKEAESKLSFGQIAALRFADDDEFKVLLEKALQENTNPKDIKQSIKNWQADNMRV
ncbi:MAG: DUF6526 family protein [Arachidicoccus sp.]|nr:DUF6526 family protein [Arachidicoccus sp.]